MLHSSPPPPITLWTIETRNSTVTCQLVTGLDGSFELRITQGADIVVSQPFLEEALLRAYADALHDRLMPLAAGIQSKDGDPDRETG